MGVDELKAEVLREWEGFCSRFIEDLKERLAKKFQEAVCAASLGDESGWEPVRERLTYLALKELVLNQDILYEQAHRLVEEAKSRLASEDKEAAAEALRQIADYIYGDIANVGCKVSEAVSDCWRESLHNLNLKTMGGDVWNSGG